MALWALRRAFGLVGVAAAFCAIVTPVFAAPVKSCGKVLETTGEWDVASPAASGFDEEVLCKLTEELEGSPRTNIHAFLVIRHDKLVYEAYFSGEDTQWGRPPAHATFSSDTLHDVRSISKSTVSLILGAIIDQGLIGSADETVLDGFPDLTVSDASGKSGITLHHLLTMTSGLSWDEANPAADATDSSAWAGRHALTALSWIGP